VTVPTATSEARSTTSRLRPVPGGRLTFSQNARRARIISAVLELASEGGYEAVQLREVSRRADVAIRTIYNYYGSRDELLLAALLEWRRGVYEESIKSVRGSTPCERLLSLFRFFYEVFEQDPNRLEAFMRVQQTPSVVEFERTGLEITGPTIDFELSSFDSAFAEDFMMIVDTVVYGSLSRCASGRFPITEAWAQVERTIRRLMASHDPSIA
jgi:TetR/AcrR family transcriptional regulator, cholesterol catabolism regulator